MGWAKFAIRGDLVGDWLRLTSPRPLGSRTSGGKAGLAPRGAAKQPPSHAVVLAAAAIALVLAGARLALALAS
jgi:hypothetical protein